MIEHSNLDRPNMTVHLRDSDRNFTKIPNSLITSDLSSNALRVLEFVLSLPDKWHFSISGTATILPLGQKAIKTALDELIEKGYCQRTQRRIENKLDGYDYIFSDCCMKTPAPLHYAQMNKYKANKHKANKHKATHNKDSIDKESREKEYDPFAKTKDRLRLLDERRASAL